MKLNEVHRCALRPSPPLRSLRRSIASIALLLFLPSQVLGAEAQEPAPRPEYRSDRIFVKPSVSNLTSIHASLGTRTARKWPRIGSIEVIALPKGLSVEQAIARFREIARPIWPRLRR